jgi:diaminohydroxyphosphoribosylaminopyrimidine deaminase/5-amino-6-(5-phosphoribosylamino)uracil reductase
VLVRDGAVVGEGWHERAGEPHAEVHALRRAGQAAQGATAYVTLEPCSHTGRTGPCCEALLAAGVRRVVAAMQDPNPLVAGAGLARLRAAGVEVRSGVREPEARALNPGFIARMTRGWPWVRLKIGMSLDGRTALANGVSQWITGGDARRDVQRLRSEACAVMTGSGTVAADDPQLNVREFPVGRQPLRVVVDGALRLDPAARILRDAPTLVLTRAGLREDPAAAVRARRLEGAGARVVGIPAAAGDPEHLDLALALRALAGESLNEILVEAGQRLNGALLAAGLVDECVFYIAPSLLGDAARGPAQLGPFTRLDERLPLRFLAVRQVGTDLCVTAVPEHPARTPL